MKTSMLAEAEIIRAPGSIQNRINKILDGEA